MAIIKRFWVPVLVLMMVGIHAAIIGYVRSRVAMLGETDEATQSVGLVVFQPAADPGSTYQFQLDVVIEPTRRVSGGAAVQAARLLIIEAAEQQLRRAESPWLEDPMHEELRRRLMTVMLQHLREPVVQRVVITRWMRTPYSPVAEVAKTFGSPKSQPKVLATSATSV